MFQLRRLLLQCRGALRRSFGSSSPSCAAQWFHQRFPPGKGRVSDKKLVASSRLRAVSTRILRLPDCKHLISPRIEYDAVVGHGIVSCIEPPADVLCHASAYKTALDAPKGGGVTSNIRVMSVPPMPNIAIVSASSGVSGESPSPRRVSIRFSAPMRLISRSAFFKEGSLMSIAMQRSAAPL
ncbi:MAG: hypothetical protein R2912_04265 [Eubacteriales bacterium]